MNLYIELVCKLVNTIIIELESQSHPLKRPFLPPFLFSAFFFVTSSFYRAHSSKDFFCPEGHAPSSGARGTKSEKHLTEFLETGKREETMAEKQEKTQCHQLFGLGVDKR